MNVLLAVGDAADATSIWDRWQLFVGAFFFLYGLILSAGGSDSAPAGRDPAGPAAGRVAAEEEGSRSYAATLFAAAAVMLAWGLGGGGIALLVGIPAGIWMVSSFTRSDHAEEAMGGYSLAEEQWRRQQEIAAQNPIQPPDPYAHLRHLPIDLVPPPEPVVQQVPEPHYTPDQAAELYRDQMATGGWAPRSGSAIAAVMSIDGQPDPAQAAILKVGRDLGWGRVISGEAGQRWEQWVSCVHVVELNGGDAKLVLNVTHSSIDEATIRKHLPALLRALKVRDGEVHRDINSGALVLTVTNEKPAEPVADADLPVDPNWS